MSFRKRKQDAADGASGAGEGEDIPPHPDVDRWMEENYDGKGLGESQHIRIAFRTVGSSKTDHCLNVRAAWLTRLRGEVFPYGEMCHVELILQVKPDLTPEARKELSSSQGRDAVAAYEARKYVTCSVTKKVWDGKDPKNPKRDLYKPGCVHCKFTHPDDWKNKYVFLQANSSRKSVERALRFALLNNGMPFNHVGYYANLLVPGGIGARRFSEDLMRKRRRYFCSEFIVVALQAMALEDLPSRSQHPIHQPRKEHWKHIIVQVNPATSNPNMLYRRLRGADGVSDDLPLGKVVNV